MASRTARVGDIRLGRPHAAACLILTDIRSEIVVGADVYRAVVTHPLAARARGELEGDAVRKKGDGSKKLGHSVEGYANSLYMI